MNNQSGPNEWEVTRETGEGVPLAVSNGEREFDVKTGGVGVHDVIDPETGESVGTLFDA